MFWLVFWICLHVKAASSSEGGVKDTWFGLYAGNLTYSNNTDGGCIACNGTCNGETAVYPHSWTAQLVYWHDNERINKTRESCTSYALDVAKYGVVGFTWRSFDYICSVHVEDGTHNIGAEMINYNGFDWTEEYPDNTGHLILVTYPKGFEGVDNVENYCFYGLDINRSQNVIREVNMAIIIFVVFVITAWNGWMNHTDNYPPSHGSAETSELNLNQGQGIYSDDSLNKKED